MATIKIPDNMFKQAKRWARQTERLDKAWNCILQDDNREKADRMTRVLAIQENKRARMGITLHTLITGVEL